MVTGVFLRSLYNGEKERLEKILNLCGIKEYTIYDLALMDAKDITKCDLAIIFGKATERLAKGLYEFKFTFPALKQLEVSDENKKHRQDALRLIEDVKQFLIKPVLNLPENSWNYAIVNLPNSKKLCVYEEKRPQVQADIYMSRDDSNLLMKLKEIFKADSIIIQEEEIISAASH